MLATDEAGDPWVSATAAFHLAAVSAAVAAAAEAEGGGGSGGRGPAGAGAGGGAGEGVGGSGGAAAGLKPLAAYPLEGAMRPLAAALLDR